ncbi:hypothetical protein D6764_01535 [Candidatus Woesearchaeota archaeon]|nr:MAG: hypothetical protein D6764_01535 [Candidatus Woesearchaeota archaeon]
MTYKLTFARYDPEGEQYLTASRRNATHIVTYGDGAMIHARPLPSKKAGELEKFILADLGITTETFYPGNKKSRNLEERIPQIKMHPEGRRVHELTKPTNWLTN